MLTNESMQENMFPKFKKINILQLINIERGIKLKITDQSDLPQSFKQI